MAKDFIPRSDADFDAFFKNFHDVATNDPAKFDFSPADVTQLNKSYADWSTLYSAHTAAQQTSRSASEAKDKGRDAGEQALRGLTKKVNGHPDVDNAMRAQLGLQAHDTARTPMAVPDSHPIVRPAAQHHNTVVVHFVDVNTPQKTAKPHGAHACEIRSFVGDTPPADPNAFAFLAYDTRTPYTDTHPVADAGKMVHYVGRWINAKLEPGPWGDVASIKIPV